MKKELLLAGILAFLMNSSDLTADNYCNRLSEIKVIPFKGEKVNNEVYNGLIEKGQQSIPCLIEKLTDTTLTKDPRKAPSYRYTTIGDVAFFVLLDITGLSLESFLPEDVRVAYQKEGIYAYFKFVEEPRNRGVIQNNWRTWLLKEKGKRPNETIKK
jgi:hypothetical protein